MGLNQCRDKISNAFRDANKKITKRKELDFYGATDTRPSKKSNNKRTHSESGTGPSLPVIGPGSLPTFGIQPSSSIGMGSRDPRNFVFDRAVHNDQSGLTSLTSHNPYFNRQSFPSNFLPNFGDTNDSFPAFAGTHAMNVNAFRLQPSADEYQVTHQIGNLPLQSLSPSLPLAPLNFTGEAATALNNSRAASEDQMLTTNLFGNVPDGFTTHGHPIITSFESLNSNFMPPVGAYRTLSNVLDHSAAISTAESSRVATSSSDWIANRHHDNSNLQYQHSHIDPLFAALEEVIYSTKQYDDEKKNSENRRH
jgi:hypothetical protein